MRRVLLAFAILLAILMFGCTESAPEPINIEGYDFVRPDFSSDEVTASAIRLHAALKGFGIPIKTDYLSTRENEVPGEHEILFGKTNRPESLEVLESFDTSDPDKVFYTVRAVGKKLVIIGSNDDATSEAAELFLSEYVNAELPGDLDDTRYFSISERLEKERKEYINSMLEVFADTTKFGNITGLESKFNSPRILPEKGEHPRLMFRADELENIRKNLTASENSAAYEEYKKLVDTAFDGVITGEPSYGEFGKKLSVIEAKALEYALNHDEVVGYEAINAIANVILTATYDHYSDNYRAMGQVMLTAAEVYDWCYDLMTDEMKAAFTAGCETLITPKMEMGFPPTKQGTISGHGSEAQVLRDWLAFAIAAYDEYPDIYEFIAGMIFDKYVPVRDYYYRSGAIHQGNNYGPYRFNFDLWSAWLFKRMSGELIYDESMKNVMYGFIYGLRPDGQQLRIGDDWSERNKTYNVEYKVSSFYAANLFGDEVIKSESKRLLNDYKSFNYANNTLTPVQYLVFNDPTLGTKDISTLPLTYYMGSPLGQTLTRTGWNIVDSDDILVQMKIGEHTGTNHDHLDSGNFQIFYKGILASESGVYDSYWSPQDKNYNKTTVAHNCLLIYDPDEDCQNHVNCGGQRYVSETGNIDAWMNDAKYRYGKVTAHEETDTHVVLTGDITSAYSDKVDEVLRSMVFIPTGDSEMPGIFAVYDRVTAAKESFRKTFLLHMQTEPEVSGNVTTIINNGGKLVNQTLLPSDALIEKIGGKGNEFNISGVNYPTTIELSDDRATEAGWGRVEISPADANLADSFLNVMYVTDAGDTAAVKAELIESENSVGAKLGEYAIVFAKSSERTDELSFTLPGAAKVIAIGLSGGEYEVNGETLTATDDGGVIEFNAEGKVTIRHR